MFIYKITNTKNGKVYVGQTIHEAYKRINYHKNSLRRGDHVNKHLQNAYNLDKEFFEYEVLASARHIIELNELEVIYMNIFQSNNSQFGYNIKHGGNNGNHSNETKTKMSLVRKGRKYTEDHKRKISESLKGHTVSEETRSKFRNRKISEEMKRQISEKLKGRKASPELKEKLSKCRIGISPSTETRLKLSLANKGKKMSDESRKKMSEAAKNRKKKKKTPE